MMNWREVKLDERAIRKFFAYTGLTAPPYSLTPPARKMTGGELQEWLKRKKVSWSYSDEVMRNAISLSIRR